MDRQVTRYNSRKANPIRLMLCIRNGLTSNEQARVPVRRWFGAQRDSLLRRFKCRSVLRKMVVLLAGTQFPSAVWDDREGMSLPTDLKLQAHQLHSDSSPNFTIIPQGHEYITWGYDVEGANLNTKWRPLNES